MFSLNITSLEIIITRDSSHEYKIARSLHSCALTPNKFQAIIYEEDLETRMQEDDETKRMRKRQISDAVSFSLHAKHRMEFPRGCFRVTSFGERRPDGFATRTTTTASSPVRV